MYNIDAFGYMQGDSGDIMHVPPVQLPPAVEFSRVPPVPFGHSIVMPGRAIQSMPNRKTDPAQINGVIDEFRHNFSQHAAGLLSTGVLPIPPGHPLYSKQMAISALEAERDSLLKENADLKRRLEDGKEQADQKNIQSFPQ